MELLNDALKEKSFEEVLLELETIRKKGNESYKKKDIDQAKKLYNIVKYFKN
jgi:hypothetical protein